VKVRFAFTYPESDLHRWVQCLDSLLCVITARIKIQPIDSGGQILAFRKKLRTPAILIGVGCGQQAPPSAWRASRRRPTRPAS